MEIEGSTGLPNATSEFVLSKFDMAKATAVCLNEQQLGGDSFYEANVSVTEKNGKWGFDIIVTKYDDFTGFHSSTASGIKITVPLLDKDHYVLVNDIIDVEINKFNASTEKENWENKMKTIATSGKIAIENGKKFNEVFTVPVPVTEFGVYKIVYNTTNYYEWAELDMNAEMSNDYNNKQIGLQFTPVNPFAANNYANISCSISLALEE